MRQYKLSLSINVPTDSWFGDAREARTIQQAKEAICEYLYSINLQHSWSESIESLVTDWGISEFGEITITSGNNKKVKLTAQEWLDWCDTQDESIHSKEDSSSPSEITLNGHTYVRVD